MDSLSPYKPQFYLLIIFLYTSYDLIKSFVNVTIQYFGPRTLKMCFQCDHYERNTDNCIRRFYMSSGWQHIAFTCLIVCNYLRYTCTEHMEKLLLVFMDQNNKFNTLLRGVNRPLYYFLANATIILYVVIIFESFPSTWHEPDTISSTHSSCKSADMRSVNP